MDSVNHFWSFNTTATDSDGNNITAPQTIGRLLSDNGYFTGLIGKYHVWPMDVYHFDYLKSEVNGYSLSQVSRNITYMKLLMIDFFDNYIIPNNYSWFLEMSFHDTHRRGDKNDKYGPFYNYWGNGTEENGYIPDWTPINYNYKNLSLPYFMPQTDAARKDYAAYLTTFSRLDQGVGLFLDIIKQRGLLNDTMIIFSSDNGSPFPSAKTNLYEEGQIEPFMISLPDMWEGEQEEIETETEKDIDDDKDETETGKKNKTNRKNRMNSHNSNKKNKKNGVGLIYSDYMASNLDIFPTILDWLDIPYPSYTLNSETVKLTGESLLDVVSNKVTKNKRESNIFGSHQMHTVMMYYPMRVVRNKRYRLLHNLYHHSAFQIATDTYLSPTWQNILNNTKAGLPTYWYKNLTDYYFREEWELFDMDNDFQQLNNLAYSDKHSKVFEMLKNNLTQWVNETNDPWICDQKDFVCSSYFVKP